MSAARIQTPKIQMPKMSNVESRISRLDWPQIVASLHQTGWARTGQLLTEDECHALRALYTDDGLFRNKVVMARHHFGLGEYKYFAYPLPALVGELRESLYARLVEVANEWSAKLGIKPAYPATHHEFIRQCSAKGQKRPTPLMLRYERGAPEGRGCGIHHALASRAGQPGPLPREYPARR
jgi:hypothetical protein